MIRTSHAMELSPGRSIASGDVEDGTPTHSIARAEAMLPDVGSSLHLDLDLFLFESMAVYLEAAELAGASHPLAADSLRRLFHFVRPASRSWLTDLPFPAPAEASTSAAAVMRERVTPSPHLDLGATGVKSTIVPPDHFAPLSREVLVDRGLAPDFDAQAHPAGPCARAPQAFTRLADFKLSRLGWPQALFRW